MVDVTNVFLKKFVLAVCQAFELLSRRIHLHQQRVTIICLNLANRLKLSPANKTTLFYAGLMHDIGIFLARRKIDILNFDCEDILPHCEEAYSMLNRIELLCDAAVPIRYHHDNWSGPNESGLAKDKIPLLSQIIRLADRMEVLIRDDKGPAAQSTEILNKIKHHRGTWFNPQLVDALLELTGERVFWLTLTPEFTDSFLNEFAPEDTRKVTLDNMIEVASVFAQIVDYKSHYTKGHSVAVTSLSLKIGIAMRWSKSDLKRLWAAALLHDLGKLAIPNELLEKSGALTPQEYEIIKRHPYFGYVILNAIPAFDEIAEWTLFHHEHLNGKGYPFGVDTDNIPQGARIIAVADKYTALTEERTYHKRTSPEKALQVLEEEARQNVIDKKILDVLKNIVRKNIAYL
ncbi:MAG: HD domain-containing protein [Planctomycetes bacterium]|nr:HD domain-containing protein [Planctomycetota bacterium]